MHPFDDDYLSKMLPGFEKKPKPETAAPPIAPGRAEPAQKAAPETKPAKPEVLTPERPDPELFNAIAAYISKYLVCPQDQLTVLTLWVAHTWSFRHFPTAAYLHVRSPELQCGKSICLMLLRELSSNPCFAAGASAETLTKSLLADAAKDAAKDADSDFDTTLILDDCQHTFGPSERQPLVALLNSGSDDGRPYLSAKDKEYSFFGPKAFAGNAPLPESLAARCIPINLRRKKPSDPVTRLHLDSIKEEARKLVEKLGLWTKRNSDALKQLAPKVPAQFPLGFAPREQACAEPLLHIADLVGGSWPKRARDAVTAIFKAAQGSDGIELLCDLRVVFYSKKDPEYLSTKDILALLAQFEHRPWSNWGRSSGKKLAARLHPFGIHGYNLHCGSAPVFRGYLCKDFQDAWERYVPPISTELRNQSGI